MAEKQLVPYTENRDNIYPLKRKGFNGIINEKWDYNNKEQEGDRVDENTKIILDRLDKDIRDHKQEVRDRETRLLTDAQEREQRYRNDLLEQQRLYREEAKEREERMMGAMNQMKTDLMEAFKDVKEESKVTRHTVIALTISVVLGVAAMVVAMFLAK